MIYLLDTNVCIRYLNGQSRSIQSHLKQTTPTAIRLCSVVKGELLFGAAKSNARDKTLTALKFFMDAFVSLPFDDMCANVYANIRLELEARGTPIGPNDLLIAATAGRTCASLVIGPG